MKKLVFTALAVICFSGVVNAKQPAKNVAVAMSCMQLYMEIYDMMTDLGASSSDAHEFASDCYGGCIAN
ncbi:hypothetical protein [Flavobacterium sp.]|uniref:hypothetical protein n=1 Tax=Flavobacterium sp. TaxID=239 RepID=UPI003D1246C9